MTTIEMIPSEKTFIEWANDEFYVNMTEKEAGLLLGYVLDQGYGVCRDATDGIIVVDTKNPENGVIARGFDGLLDCVRDWNYELRQNAEIDEKFHEQCIIDMKVIARIYDSADLRYGVPMGTPTVKELIAMLSKLPEDYRVYCCGGENYLYLWENTKGITIDCEWSLG